MTWRTLISAAELLAVRSGGTDVVVLDCGFDLADPGAGERGYAAGHVAGARYVHLDRDLCGAKTGRNGRHPLPDREAFAARVGSWGIGPATQVVTYDAQGGSYAARAWWMFRWLGHEAVAVLDGGLAAWQAAGGAVTTAPPEERPAVRYMPSGNPMPTVDAGHVQAGLARPGELIVLDARSGERYRGEAEPIDPVAGRIPGSRHRFFKDNLDGVGRFKPPAALREEFIALGLGGTPGQVAHACGSGVTACVNLLAMAHAGLEGTALYPGSWSEWCADPARPVARG